MSIDKPAILEKYDLIVIMSLSEEPKFPLDIMRMPYSKSDLAINVIENKVQVYVNSSTKAGIKEFLKAYPNAEIQESAVLEDTTNWRLLAFPANSNDNESALDSYFKGRHDEFVNKKLTEAVKRKEL